MDSRWAGLRRVEFRARILGQRRSTRQESPEAVRGRRWLLTALAAGLIASYASNRGPGVRLPRVLDFGSVGLQRSDTLQIASIANVGSSPLVVSLVELSGDAASDFVMSEDHCTRAVLQPHGECPIAVRFSPSIEGKRIAHLMIRDNAPNSEQEIQLRGIGTISGGTGTASMLQNSGFQFEPAELEFYSRGPAASAERPLLIRNIGSVPLRLADLSINGAGKNDFRLIRSCANVEIPPGDACQALVRFTPSRGGNSVASVAARTNSASLLERSAVLHGTFVSAEAMIDLPRVVNFAPQIASTETTLQFKVVSSGNAPLNIYKVEPSGDSFSEHENCSGQMLPPGRSCFVSVSFHPQHEGNAKGAVTFLSNAGNSPATVTINGMGTTPPRGAIELDPSAWNFGNRLVTPGGREPLFFWAFAKTFSVKAPNTLPAILGKVIIAGQNADDFRLRPECGPALDPGTTCRVKVGFLPHGEGLRTAQVTFTGADKTVALSGTGVLPTPHPPVAQSTLSVAAVWQSADAAPSLPIAGSFQTRAGGSAIKTPFTQQMSVTTKVTLYAQDVPDKGCRFEKLRVDDQVSQGRSLIISLNRDMNVVMIYSCLIQ